MPRPLMQLGVGDLEALFTKSKTDVKVLKQLEHELQYRQGPRAVALLAEVQAAMYGAAPVAPAPAPAMPVPAPAPQQTGLWERPTAPATGLAASPIAAPRPAEPIKAPTPPAVPKTPEPAMPVEDAYKLLKATAGSTWESIEQTRRQMVQRLRRHFPDQAFDACVHVRWRRQRLQRLRRRPDSQCPRQQQRRHSRRCHRRPPPCRMPRCPPRSRPRRRSASA